MSNFAKPVIETIVHSGIQRDDIVLIGSSVMALNGIRPAHDVDLVVRPEVFHEFSQQGATPSGLELRKKEDGVHGFRLLGEEPVEDEFLPIDLMTFQSKSGHGWIGKFDKLKEISELYASTQGPISHVSLGDVLAIKSRTLRLKDLADTLRIRKHLRTVAKLN